MSQANFENARAAAPAKLELFPVLPGQFVDRQRRLWVLDDRRQPGTLRDRHETPGACACCGGPLGDLAYLRQVTSGEARCEGCVEVRAASEGEADV